MQSSTFHSRADAETVPVASWLYNTSVHVCIWKYAAGVTAHLFFKIRTYLALCVYSLHVVCLKVRQEKQTKTKQQRQFNSL